MHIIEIRMALEREFVILNFLELINGFVCHISHYKECIQQAAIGASFFCVKTLSFK